MTADRLPRSTRAKLNRPDPDPGAAQRRALRAEMTRLAIECGLDLDDDDDRVGGSLILIKE